MYDQSIKWKLNKIFCLKHQYQAPKKHLMLSKHIKFNNKLFMCNNFVELFGEVYRLPILKNNPTYFHISKID